MTEAAGRDRTTSFAGRNAENYGVVLLLVLLVYVVGSLIPYKGWQGIILALLGVATALYALIAARVRARVLRWAAAAGAVQIALTIAGAFQGGLTFDGLAAMIQTLLFLLAALAVLRGIVLEEHVHANSIAGAIAVYIFLGLLYASVYVALDRLQPGHFFQGATPVQEGDFLFFSMTTLTTTGYGDLVPAGQPGRMLAALEMLTGQIFVVTLIARLVTSWRPGEWLRRGAGIGRRPRDLDS